MSALSNVHATSLLNTSLRSGTYYLALFLTDPDGKRKRHGSQRRRIRPQDHHVRHAVALCPAKNRSQTALPSISAR